MMKRYVTALPTNTHDAPTLAYSTPPIAGPMTLERFMFAELREIAPAMSWRSTSVGIRAE